jgi:hypothetical protein
LLTNVRKIHLKTKRMSEKCPFSKKKYLEARYVF